MKSLIKFLAVGVVNTIIGATVMFLLYNIFGASYWFSSACNYIVGAAVSFFLNKFFTFKNKERSVKQVLLFALTVAVCYFLSYGLAKPLMMNLLSGYSQKIQENAAMVTGMGLYTLLNFTAQKFIVFKREKGAD